MNQYNIRSLINNLLLSNHSNNDYISIIHARYVTILLKMNVINNNEMWSTIRLIEKIINFREIIAK